MRVGSRRTQPYRKSAPRAPGASLQAMRKGRTAYGQNPQDISRLATKKARRRRRRRLA